MLKEAEEIIIDGEEVSLDEDKEENVIELHEDPEEALEEPSAVLVVEDSGSVSAEPINDGEVVIDIKFESPIPGVDPTHAEEILSISDTPEEKQDEDKDNNSAAKKKKVSLKWDWKPEFENNGPSGFMKWVSERFHDVPTHSGRDAAGIERAISYLNKLNSEISACMKYDEDGQLDSKQIEKARQQIENGIDALEKALKAINKSKKDKKKKADTDNEIIKEAQRVVGLQGNYINVPLLISSLARMCINGSISAGHSMEDNIQKVCDKFKLTDREKFSLAFLIQDMGFAVRADRFFLDVMEKRDEKEDGVDFAAGYQA